MTVSAFYLIDVVPCVGPGSCRMGPIRFVAGWHKRLVHTASPAVAERPHNAPCLSVVSFNSTICQAQSSVISYFRFRFTAVNRRAP